MRCRGNDQGTKEGTSSAIGERGNRAHKGPTTPTYPGKEQGTKERTAHGTKAAQEGPPFVHVVALSETGQLAYRVKQVAQMLNLPVSTIHDLVRRRVIESVRIGEGRRKLVLIPAEAVRQLLERYRIPARANGARG